MHSECTILMPFLKKIRGRPPGPPPAGGGDPLPHPPPFGASRLSEAFGFIGHLCPPGNGGSGSAPGEQYTSISRHLPKSVYHRRHLG